MVINIAKYVDHCYSNSDGDIIFNLIIREMKRGRKITLSFQAIDGVSSSFVNSAFIPLLEYYDFDFVRAHLSLTNSTKQINEMIKDRFSFEVSRKKILAVM